ncbi:hypothetical protein O181_041001 [Austropuccinia psidii MF-1]|uniref:Integrase zinc-binding domain-containing protein n=1 Tax=Austropuccinia psidii MF-1 TaxID=1389203 RepID=A0A9Q3DCC8_9BASI|nr:hypothetical protein [Austropuccinia psidii MF-1]
MEIDTNGNFKFSEWEPGSGTPGIDYIGSEGTETPTLGISSSELQNKFFDSVHGYYAKRNHSSILMSLLQQNYRSPELESQLEEPWVTDYKDKTIFLMDGLLYDREKHANSPTVIYRDHLSLILKECHDCPYMGHMSEERISSTACWPQWEQELSEYINTCQIVSLEVYLTCPNRPQLS